MENDPAKLNCQLSAAVQSAAESKLGRSLTPEEEYRIWNLGSFMQLELVDRNIEAANSAQEVAQRVHAAGCLVCRALVRSSARKCLIINSEA